MKTAPIAVLFMMASILPGTEPAHATPAPGVGILVRFRDGHATLTRTQALEARYPDLKFDAAHSGKYFSRYIFLKKSSLQEEDLIFSKLSRDPHVLSAEIDQPVFLDPVSTRPVSSIPIEDPQLKDQGYPQKLGWFDARAKASAGLNETLLAIADNAIDIQHPELAKRVALNSHEIPGNRIDDDRNGKVDDVAGWDFNSNDASVLPDRAESHGTHVAGTAFAEIANGIGIAGVAPAEVKMLPIKVSGAPASNQSFPSLFALAIDYAIERGAKVMSLSYPTNSESRVFREALSRAQAAGLIFVNSAGNSGENIDQARGTLRSSFDNILFVAASDLNDARPSFSNFGQSVEIAAPGFEVLSLAPRGRYQRMSGTSMAAPHVSATLAWIRAVHPTWSHRQVLDYLLARTDRLNWREPIHGGRLSWGTLF